MNQKNGTIKPTKTSISLETTNMLYIKKCPQQAPSEGQML